MKCKICGKKLVKKQEFQIGVCARCQKANPYEM